MDEISHDQSLQQVETLELINAEVTASLARQSDAGGSIDTKAVILVGYAAAVASFLATRHAEPVLAMLAYAAYGIAAGFGIWAYAVRFYQDVPEPRQLFNGYLSRPKAEVLAALAATRVEVFESNERKHVRKVRRWQISVVSLVVGVALMLLAMTKAYW
jgi:hypothetical protein